MRHALIILAGVVSIGAIWVGAAFLGQRTERRQGRYDFVVQRGISGLAAIISFIILAYLSIIWD